MKATSIFILTASMASAQLLATPKVICSQAETLEEASNALNDKLVSLDEKSGHYIEGTAPTVVIDTKQDVPNTKTYSICITIVK